MNAIRTLILAVVGAYFGLALIPGMNDTIATITTPTYDSGVVGIISLILLAVAVAIVYNVLRSTDIA